jgi:hypothetical protein
MVRSASSNDYYVYVLGVDTCNVRHWWKQNVASGYGSYCINDLVMMDIDLVGNVVLATREGAVMQYSRDGKVTNSFHMDIDVAGNVVLATREGTMTHYSRDGEVTTPFHMDARRSLSAFAIDNYGRMIFSLNSNGGGFVILE